MSELEKKNKRLIDELVSCKSKLRTRNKYLEEVKRNLRQVTKERDYLLKFFKGECSMCAKNGKCVSYCYGEKWVWNGKMEVEDENSVQ